MGSFYKAKCDRLTLKAGSRSKAKVAVANRIARVSFLILSGQINKFKDLGSERVANKDRQIKNAIRKLESLGLTVHKVDHQKIELTNHSVVKI